MGSTIGNAPSGADSSLDGTEKVPVSGNKYTLISTIRDYIWAYLTSLTAKITLTGADKFSIADSAASFEAKNITWTNVLKQAQIETPYTLSVTSASNLVVAIKHIDGSNASATNPINRFIGGSLRSITAALSVTIADGTNWSNQGSAELATYEVDRFVYLGYNATDGVVIGHSRIPYANIYSDFSATSTNEKYCAISTITNAAAGDSYVNIGRFAATLSAGAGYTWSVPTFTGENLIQRPILSTRWLTYQPAWSGSGSLTYTSVTTSFARYMIEYYTCEALFRSSGTTGGTTSTTLFGSLPFDLRNANLVIGYAQCNDGTPIAGRAGITSGTPDLLGVAKYDNSNWALAAGKVINAQIRYEI